MTKKDTITEFYEFMIDDPFNKGNRIDGYLSHHRDTRYGALDIHKVNGEKVDYPLIYTTPKLRYPYGLQGNFNFPSASQIISYKKYDGTNIFMYRYKDSNNRTYITYKVRRYPFLRVQFLTMWQHILKMYPNIPSLFSMNPDVDGFSFEMYGSANPHLIKYDVSLETALLFGIKGEGNIIPLTDIETKRVVPIAEKVSEITDNYVWNYQEEQRFFTEKLHVLPKDKNEDTGTQMYTGDEGSVWYLKDKIKKDKWSLFKCKARDIEIIHQSNRSLSITVIRATAINALEEYDNLTVDILKEYLNEEFPMHQINYSIQRIEKTVEHVNELGELKKEVREILTERKIDIGTTKIPDILRDINNLFSKKQIQHVFLCLRAIRRNEGYYDM